MKVNFDITLLTWTCSSLWSFILCQFEIGHWWSDGGSWESLRQFEEVVINSWICVQYCAMHYYFIQIIALRCLPSHCTSINQYKSNILLYAFLHLFLSSFSVVNFICKTQLLTSKQWVTVVTDTLWWYIIF